MTTTLSDFLPDKAHLHKRFYIKFMLVNILYLKNTNELEFIAAAFEAIHNTRTRSSSFF